MPAERIVKTQRIVALRDLAVAAAMRRGGFEESGDTKLVVLREAGLMIIYRTPFNPLPPLTDRMKFDAALRGKGAYREPYGIEIWQDRLGKVLSVGWRDQAPPVVDGYEQGLWEQTLAQITGLELDSGLCRKRASAVASGKQPPRGKHHGHSRGRKRTQISGRAGSDG
jgi:hypothetical protein